MSNNGNHEQWLIDFGSRLRIERERLGLTRLALAELAHTEQGYIVQIERGDRSPSLRTFVNLLSALGVSADALIFGDIANSDGKEATLIEDFTGFLSRRSTVEVQSLFEIVRLVTRHRNLENGQIEREDSPQ